MKTHKVWSTLFAVICLGVMASPTWAQGTMERKLNELRSQADERSQMVEQWERDATIILSLTVIIGVLGVVMGVIQRFEFKGSKATTVVLGAVISLVTLLNATFFKYDHRTYQKAAKEAKLILDDISLALAEDISPYDKADLNAWEESVRKKLREVTSIEVKLVASNTNWTISIVPEAYAESRQGLPSWVSNPPSDDYFFCFVGFGEGSTVERARELSSQDARDVATSYFVAQLEHPEQSGASYKDNEAVSRALVKSAEITKTFFTREPSEGRFRYYTLLSFNKKFLESELRFKAIEQSIDPSSANQMAEELNARQSPGKAYYERRSQTYDWILGQAQGTLSEELYEKFYAARKLRLGGEYEEAAGMLYEILTQAPDFYFGWYNLGLAYDQMNRVAEADEAYKKAVLLESSQQVRDPSIYNTYGFFLYRQKRYSEATVQLEKALELDPSHPKARNTLRIIRGG